MLTPRTDDDAVWPALPYAEWKPTLTTVHMWAQIVGKVKLGLTPFLNEWWNVTFAVTARGLSTATIPFGQRMFQVDFDFIDHGLAIQVSDGSSRSMALGPRSVAEFHRELMDNLESLGIQVNINTHPVEVDNGIPFAEDKVHAQYDPNNPNAGQFGRGGRGGPSNDPPPPMSNNEINRRVDEFLVASGARLRVNDAAREHGQIIAFHNRTYDVAKAVPTVVLRNEDYGRISRILADGTPVELEFTIVNKVYPDGSTAYNAIAEIPGTDKKDEIVMLGGHLDSWHGGTGATDNGAGTVVAMEAVRILKAIGIAPKRTIRIALWSGEEEGLLGSRAYVAEHFATRPEPDAAERDLPAAMRAELIAPMT